MMAKLYDTAIVHKSKLKLKSLQSTWSPFLVLLKLVGLYHYKENCPWWKNVWKCYSFLMIFFVLGMFALFVVQSFDKIIGKDGKQKIQFESFVDILWYTVMQGYSVGLFLASHQSSKLGAFFGKWLELSLLPGMQKALQTVRKKTWFMTVFIAVVVLFHWCEIAYCRITEGRTIFTVFGYCILQCIEFFSLAFLVLMFTTLCTIISVANSQFLKFLNNPGKTPSASWETCRVTYVLVIELVDIADNVLCFPVGWAILCYVMELTLFSFAYVLYFQDAESKMVDILNSAFWNLMLLLCLFFILWKGSAVHNQVQVAYPYMNKLRLGIFPLSMQNELIFLQYRLGHATIGISVFKVHLITRVFASSIVSAYITYLIILLQFKNSK